MGKDQIPSDERGSLFAGLTFIGVVTLPLCILFSKLLGTFLSGGDTGDDVPKRVFQNADGANGGRTIVAQLDITQTPHG